MLIPAWYDTADAAAVVGTARVRTVNPSWLIALDRRQGAYCLLGPGPGGWVPMQWVTDEKGRYLHANEIDWTALTHALFRGRMKGEDAVSQVTVHNERLHAQRERDFRDRKREEAGYFQEAFRREIDGDGRWNAEDVGRGFRSRWV